MSVAQPSYCHSDDGLDDRRSSVSCARLRNSEILSNIDAHLVHLSDSARSDIGELIKDCPDLFSDIPTQTNVISHDIEVGDHKPIKQHAYGVHPTKRALMQQEVKYLLDHGFMVTSSSDWSSQSLFVPKPDQTPRFCNDYRKVNAVTNPNSFPLQAWMTVLIAWDQPSMSP